MKEAVSCASERRVCRVLGVARSSMRIRCNELPKAPAVDEVLAERIWQLIHVYPTFGYRRLWAMLKYREGMRLNRKTVYRI